MTIESAGDSGGSPSPVQDVPSSDPTDVERLSFDDAFAELRAVVAELETGGLSLEDTIARTERAVGLQLGDDGAKLSKRVVEREGLDRVRAGR